ncbi:MAG: hypothetical protein WDM77_17200 [Steroidobacteraceae bacterium]
MIKTAAAATLLVTLTVRAGDYASIDGSDKDALERALFLCTWRVDHAVPENAPTPAVCRSAAVSIDDALLQSKQWWMYWARFDNGAVVKANTQFGGDFLAFKARQRRTPALADMLLPPGIRLAKDDWRVQLVQELKGRAAAATP